MKLIITTLTAGLFALASTAGAGELYNETFDVDGTLGDYTGAGKIFTDAVAVGTPASASGGEMNMALLSNDGASLYTYTSFGGAKALLSLKFDFKGNAYGAASAAFGLYVGQFDAAADFNPNWNVHNGNRNVSMTKIAGGNPFTINAYDDANVAHTLAGNALGVFQTWALFCNDSGAEQSFLGPDGAMHTLSYDAVEEQGSWSLFVGTTLVADNVLAGNDGDTDYMSGVVMNLGRNYGGGTSDQSIDNFVIRDDLDLFLPSFTVGDMNDDGVIDNLDINPFVQALTDPAGYQTAFGLDPNDVGDINDDGVLDNLDINPFVALLTGPAAGTAVPEPASLALIGLGGLALLRRRRH